MGVSRDCVVCRAVKERERRRQGRVYARHQTPEQRYRAFTSDKRLLKQRRDLWKYFRGNPEKLKEVRWDPRWPEYRGGGPAPEYGGYVQGSFMVFGRPVVEPPTLLDFMGATD